MKTNMREFQNIATASAFNNALPHSGGNLRPNSVTQTLTALREEDPAFDKVIVTQRFERGRLVASAEAMASRMYVLMSGKVNLLCTNNEGRRLVIATLEPGAIFGEGALGMNSDQNVFAEAAEDSAVWVIPASEARSMTMQYPILGWGMLQTYGMRLMQVENSLEDVAYKKLPERLAALLVELDADPQAVRVCIQSSSIASFGSLENLVNAYGTLYRYLKDNYDSPAKLKKYWGYLANDVVFIQISTDVSSALKIFETINERGVGLNPMDLLKNLLFTQVGQAQFTQLKDEWKKITKPLEKGKEKPLFDHFVMQLESFLFYYIFTKTPTRDLERSFSQWANELRAIADAAECRCHNQWQGIDS